MKQLTIALIVLTTAVTSAQLKRMSGGGELSPTAVATWEGHDGMLDLLVLWRGSAGWLQTAPATSGANQPLFDVGGYPIQRVHAVAARGKRLELRIENNIAHIQDQTIPLQGVNVLMLDDVDGAAVKVAGTLMVEPRLPAGDPIRSIIAQSPLLTDYVKH
jgi:hypothetical protein